jgi:hypothetical protein
VSGGGVSQTPNISGWGLSGRLALCWVQLVTFKRHGFPLEVIRYAVWLHFGFTWSLHEVKELLAKRVIGVSCETIRC